MIVTDEMVERIANSIGVLVRDWITGTKPLEGRGLEHVVRLRLARLLNEAALSDGDAPAPEVAAVSLTDPLTILAGIKQFGLAPDGSDLRDLEAAIARQPKIDERYDQGRRDVLNAILALNPKVAQKLHILSGGTEETFNNHEGRLPFDVVFWVTEVAEQLGIQPRDATEGASPNE
jgi:hypothetical protein